MAVKLESRAMVGAEVTWKAKMEVKRGSVAMRRVSARSVRCWWRGWQAVGAGRAAEMMPRLEVGFLTMAC